MRNKEKMKLAVAVACLAATISVIVATLYRKPRKQSKPQSSSCYLKTQHKPQHSFKRVFADNSYSPFKHLNLSTSQTTDNYSNLHPYKSEITQLMKSSKIQFELNDGENTISDMKNSYVWVDSELKLKELADVLSKERVFAVDTEQHSLHSFLGFTALIQISTQSEDYLVDTIALHDVMPILRPVFANSSICKVFHGADNDVLWLQKDFHIYVVNLFDTAKGCEVLSKPQKSLAYLLETYCGVATNKLLQREDWRQRPLPLEMVQYARMDSHYLLYIAKHLTSELIEQDKENSACLDDKLHFVLEANRRSNAICLQLFAKDSESCPGESAASSIINRHFSDKGSASSITCHTKFQDFVRQLCTWRDLMARMHDESLKYVLSDQAIVALAADAPTSETDIYDCILQADGNLDALNLPATTSYPSAVVCSHTEDLAYIFKNDAGKPDDIFSMILPKHLGPNGSCPLSIYNYTLLSKSSVKLTNQLVSKGNTYNHSKQVSRLASRELFVQKFSCKSPAYHNCRIYANDGRLLCYCDRRKLEWYLRRDLAKLVDDDPLAVMLLFEPKGGPEDDDNDFYVQSKKNICVGCGEENHYLRYRVIPSCYRVHFPEHLKSHRSHDIVLVCVDCHEIAHSAAEKYKRIVAAEFGIPLFLQKVVDASQAQEKLGSSASTVHLDDAGVSPLELRTAAMALLRHGHRMPSKRHEELTQDTSLEVAEVEKQGNYRMYLSTSCDIKKLAYHQHPPRIMDHGCDVPGVVYNGISEASMCSQDFYAGKPHLIVGQQISRCFNCSRLLFFPFYTLRVVEVRGNNTYLYGCFVEVRVVSPYIKNSESIKRKEKKSRTVKKPKNPTKEKENVTKNVNGVTTAKKNKSKLTATQKLDEAYQRRSLENTWKPPRSHYKLLQEHHAHDPWRVLVICMLLNVTTSRQIVFKKAGRQIVMKYFGGRKISQEDLERALVVGMSPHERRRAAKKRGLSFKHVVTANEQGNSGNGTSSTPENDLGTNNEEDNRNGTSSTPGDCLDTNLVDNSHELHSEMGSNEPKNTGNGTFSAHEDELNGHMRDSSLAVERGTSCNSGGNSPTHFTAKVYLESSVTDSMSTNSGKMIPGTCLESEVSSECNGTLDGTASECNDTLNGTASSKNASKMSLLGHGPHGNQVVNHLLKEYGDDGIQEFCKRWRQVFVDAIKPRFLPAGWDVTHSGRRDFGDFSVYNPAKKGSAAATYHEPV